MVAHQQILGLLFNLIKTIHITISTEKVNEQVRLMYVAMTRAMEQLIVTSDRSSPFTQRIQSALLQLNS
jgi:ATP-dependent exoDNAse (exonuclease V) beta subunit